MLSSLMAAIAAGDALDPAGRRDLRLLDTGAESAHVRWAQRQIREELMRCSPLNRRHLIHRKKTVWPRAFLAGYWD
jgi:hypothetical protein